MLDCQINSPCGNPIVEDELSISEFNLVDPVFPAVSNLGVRTFFESTRALFFGGDQIIMYDIENIVNPIFLSQIDPIMGNSGIYLDTEFSDNFVYTISFTELYVLDISNSNLNLLNITLLTNFGTSNIINMLAIHEQIDELYLNRNSLHRINISNPQMPVGIDSFSLQAASLVFENDNLYAAANFQVSVFNRTLQSNPFVPSYNFAISYIPSAIDVSGNIMILGRPSSSIANRIEIFDVSNATNFQFLSDFELPNEPIEIHYVPPLVHIALGASGVMTVNLAEPANPRLAGQFSTRTFANTITVANNTIIVPENGLETFSFLRFNPVPQLLNNQIEAPIAGEAPLTALNLQSNTPDSCFCVDTLLNGEFLRNGESVISFSPNDIDNGLISFASFGTDVPVIRMNSCGFEACSPIQDTNFSFLQTNANSSSDDQITNIAAGLGAGLGTTLLLVIVGGGLIYRYYSNKNESLTKKLAKINNQEEDFETTNISLIEAQATKLANRYFIYNQRIPEQDQQPISKLLRQQCNHEAKLLGEGNFGKVWVGNDSETNEYIAIKQVTKEQNFDKLLQEKTTQQRISGVDLELQLSPLSYAILMAEDEELNEKGKIKRLKLRCNCFYLFAKPLEERSFWQKLSFWQSAQKPEFHLAYLDVQGKLQTLNLQTYEELKVVQHALEELSQENLEEVFNNLNDRQNNSYKNKLLRHITRKVPFSDFLNLNNHLIPALDGLIQTDPLTKETNLYLMSILAPYNGEKIKSLLADHKLNSEIREKLLAFIFRDLLISIIDMHERGFIHHDLKPDNLLFRSDGWLLTGDFGESIHIDDVINNPIKGYCRGHVAYSPPELMKVNRKTNLMFKNKIKDKNTLMAYLTQKDIHSLAITMVALITGNSNPFSTTATFNPGSDSEWRTECGKLTDNGTNEHFQKCMQNFILPSNPIGNIVKAMLNVEQHQRMPLKEALKQLETAYATVFKQENREQLFTKLFNCTPAAKVATAPTTLDTKDQVYNRPDPQFDTTSAENTDSFYLVPDNQVDHTSEVINIEMSSMQTSSYPERDPLENYPLFKQGLESFTQLMFWQKAPNFEKDERLNNSGNFNIYKH